MDSKIAESMGLGGGPTKEISFYLSKEVLPPAVATAAEREKILGTKTSLWDNAAEKGITIIPYKLDGDAKDEEEEKCPHGTDHAEAAGLSKFLKFYKEECLPLLEKSVGDWKKVPELVEEASQGSLHRSMCKNEPYSGYHVDTILAVHELCGIHSSLKPTDSCHRDADWKPKGPTYEITYKKACIALDYARSLLGKWLAKFDENAW